MAMRTYSPKSVHTQRAGKNGVHLYATAGVAGHWNGPVLLDDRIHRGTRGPLFLSPAREGEDSSTQHSSPSLHGLSSKPAL